VEQPVNTCRISALRGRQETSALHLARREVRLYFHVVAICCPRSWASGVQGILESIASENVLQFAARELRQRLARLGTGTLYIEPESVMREQLLRGFKWEAAGRMPGRGNFLLVKEAQIVIESGGLATRKRDFLRDLRIPLAVPPKGLSRHC
jgi:hypothetical protein